jgi:hypothetical protein
MEYFEHIIKMKGVAMKTVRVLIMFCVVMFLSACGGAERKAHRAQTKVANERLKLVEEYKKCVKKAGEDKNKIEACDSYLKAAESLK